VIDAWQSFEDDHESRADTLLFVLDCLAERTPAQSSTLLCCATHQPYLSDTRNLPARAAI
jgi:hypothetical protein